MSADTTAAAPAHDEARAGTASPSRGAREGRSPWLVAALVVAVLAAMLISVARGYYRDGPLEPDAPTGQGAKAVVQVLGDLGVEVEVDRHTADAAESLRAGGTVLVTAPRELSGAQLTALDEALRAGDGRLVLVQPDFVTLSYLTSLITPVGTVEEPTRLGAGPDCGDLAHGARELAVPGEEDSLRGPASLYRTAGDAHGCFTAGAGGALVAAHDGVIALGSADLLTNAHVGGADNAALALNLLGRDGELTWYVPSANDPMAATGQTLLGHLPDWAGPTLLWVLLAATIALVALAHRLGPVVQEPLPVSVRPQELVLGRARLLQQANARDAAARSLRSAAAARLAHRLGLRRESSLDALLAALAPHVEHEPGRLRDLLGPAPVPTDQDLVRLAHDLDRLEKEIDR